MTIQQMLLARSAPTYATWNPLDKSVDVTLSSGDLIASITPTSPRGNGAVRGTQGKSSGKWYWEVTLTATSDARIGIANSTMSLTTTSLGQDVNSWGYATSGIVSNNNSSVTSGAGYSPGDVIGVALDMDAGTVQFYKNGVAQGSAVSGVSGTFYPAVSGAVTGFTSSFTANFGATAYTHTPPVGYASLFF